MIQLPEDPTIIAPDDTVCVTGGDEPVSHDVAASDQGTIIANNAVATIQTSGDEALAFQATDGAEVEVLPAAAPGQAPSSTETDQAPSPPGTGAPTTTDLPVTALADTGANGVPGQVVIAALALASGWLLVLIGRRRNAS